MFGHLYIFIAGLHIIVILLRYLIAGRSVCDPFQAMALLRIQAAIKGDDGSIDCTCTSALHTTNIIVIYVRFPRTSTVRHNISV